MDSSRSASIPAPAAASIDNLEPRPERYSGQLSYLRDTHRQVSRENVEVTRRLLEAQNRGDLEGLLAMCHPDIELDWTRSVGPEPGVYRGHEGFRRFAQGYAEVFDEITFEADEFIDVGDDVVVPNVGSVRHRDGITAKVPSVFVLTIRNGLAVRFRMFNRRDEALAAVGLAS